MIPLSVMEKIPHWLTKQAMLHPNKKAIEFADASSLTFLQLKEKAQDFAKRLSQQGVGRGTRIALLSPNQIDMIVAIHALSYLEAVVVLLNIRLTKYELEDQLRRSGAKFLITTEALQVDKQIEFKQYTFEEVKQLPKQAVSLVEEIDLHRPFTMMYTSGTTGPAKGVVHTYGNHWWSATGSAFNLGIHEDDKWLLTLPLFHVGGLSILIRSVMYGMTIYLMERYEVNKLKEALYEKRVTIASLVTLMLQELVEAIEGEAFPQHVRCLLLGGGSVPQTLLREVEKKEIPLYQSYGMTETSSQIVTLSASYAREKLGSAGKPLLPAQVKIKDPDQAGIGEILVKGPMVFQGYDGLEEENKRSFTEGWFHTGDLGYFDDEQFLYVVDRRTDLIISGGENIYPTEIEEHLLEYDGIREAAVVGKQDARWGKVPVAFIVADHFIDDDQLLSFLNKRLASYKVPREIFKVDQLPRNASNKVMRHRLVELLHS